VLHELGGGRPARFEQWVDSIDGSSTPTLYFKHVLLPHVPFQYLPSGRRYRTSPHEAVPGLVGANSWGNEWLREQAYQRHLLQVGFADRLLGTAIDRLKQTGLYDKALIVVTADNGESFLHDANRHVVSEKNIEDVAPPPLFIKAPDQHAGRIVDRHVRTIDVLPSMAALLHVRLPWRVQGQSAYSPRARIPQGVQVFERSGKVLNVSLAELKARMHQSLERKLRLFGSDGHGPGLYGIGPHHELVGRPLGELHVTESPSLTARINDAGKLGTVDPSSDFLPSHITGRIVGEGAPHQRDVAVAVNGRVAAVSRTFSLRGSRTENFSQLVPESVLHAGRNRVEIFLVTRDASGLRLERVAATG
jgi:hypothetical protein